MHRLHAYLFDNNLSSPSYEVGLSGRVGDIRIIWELHGGIQSIELEWVATEAEAYRFYEKYLGYRIIIADNMLDRPVADGFITGISIQPTGIYILANGFWHRHHDQLYNFDNTAQDTNQGTLSYTTESASDTFTDDGQDFSDWVAVGGEARYEIEVTNADGTESVAFLGATVTTTEIYVYQDYGLNTTGWLGDTPTSATTASSYDVIISYDYKTTTDIIKDAVDTEVPSVTYDADNFEETGTVIGFWEPPIDEGGMYPGEVIGKLASLSDSSNREWYYYVKNKAFDGTTPQKPEGYLEPQVDDGSYDWEIRKWMLDSDSKTVERNIQELRNAVRAIYRDMADDNTVKLNPSSGTWESDTDSIDDYWRREVVLSAGDATSATANQYVKLYLNKFKDSMFSKSLTISSPYILDDSQNRWPLWAPIKYNRSWFRLADLFPTADIFDSSWDRTHCSQAMAMEYSSQSNELRIRLDTEDDSLAALLARMQAFR